MKKGLPLSIGLFLNKRIKPQQFKGEDFYPVYIQVNYGRKNVQIRPDLDTFYYQYITDDSENDVDFYSEATYITEDMFSRVYPKIKGSKRKRGKEENGIKILNHEDTVISVFQEVIEVIKNIIEQEIKVTGNFILKGFGKRVNKYFKNILLAIEDELDIDLFLFCKDKFSKNDLKQLSKLETFIEKLIFLIDAKASKIEGFSEIEKKINWLFWLAAFIAKNDQYRNLYKWTLFKQSTVSAYFDFYNKSEPKLNTFFYDKLDYITLISDPLDKKMKKSILEFIDNQ